MCKAVNLRSSQYTVYIGRPGYGKSGMFGNKFIVGTHGARGECVSLFETWFKSDEPDALAYRALVKEHIKPGDTLGCFCSPRACHGDVISAYVNNNYTF